jgi:hypothetical protein
MLHKRVGSGLTHKEASVLVLVSLLLRSLIFVNISADYPSEARVGTGLI